MINKQIASRRKEKSWLCAECVVSDLTATFKRRAAIRAYVWLEVWQQVDDQLCNYIADELAKIED